MRSAYVLAVLAAAAVQAADIPHEPGVFWEQVAEMKGTSMQMPPQTTKVCLPKKQNLSEPPFPQQANGSCKFTDVRRSGQKLSWKMVCDDKRMGGDGEIVTGGDTYTGTTRMKTPMGLMTMSVRGKKLGGDCDANQYRRELAGLQAELAHGDLGQAVAQACDDAVQNLDPGTFAAVPQCAGKKDAFCKRAGSAEGKALLRDQGEDVEQQVAKLCANRPR